MTLVKVLVHQTWRPEFTPQNPLVKGENQAVLWLPHVHPGTLASTHVQILVKIKQNENHSQALSSACDLGSFSSLSEPWGTVSLVLIKTIPQNYLLRSPKKYFLRWLVQKVMRLLFYSILWNTMRPFSRVGWTKSWLDRERSKTHTLCKEQKVCRSHCSALNAARLTFILIRLLTWICVI